MSNVTPVNTPSPVKASVKSHHIEEPQSAVEPEGEGWGWGEDVLAAHTAHVTLESSSHTPSAVNNNATRNTDGWSGGWADNEPEEEEDWDFKPVQRETKIDAKKNKENLNQKLFSKRK
jgi:hypothetical protein